MTDQRSDLGATWQPIETAPRNRVPVLGGYAHKGKWVCRVVFFDRICGRCGRWLARPGDWHVEPTHWMPLPEAPQ